MVKATKKSISAQKHVNNLVKSVLTIPYFAARTAENDVDFGNHFEAKKYRESIEAVIWTSVKIAGRVIKSCLYNQHLIDDKTHDLLMRELQNSAEFHIKTGLTQDEIDNETNTETQHLQKPHCDICGIRAGWLMVKNHRVCERCIDEIEQIVFARATDTDEYERSMSGLTVRLLESQINQIQDCEQARVLLDFLRTIKSDPHLPPEIKSQFAHLAIVSNAHSQKL